MTVVLMQPETPRLTFILPYSIQSKLLEKATREDLICFHPMLDHMRTAWTAPHWLTCLYLNGVQLHSPTLDTIIITFVVRFGSGPLLCSLQRL
jgi:hypothetical protein